MTTRLIALGLLATSTLAAAAQHLLYVAEPGIRNYEEYGGVGVLVFDIDHDYKFVRRIPTWTVPAGQKPENVKGIAASAKTGRLYVTSLNRMIAIEAVSGKRLWDKTYEGGCDRMAISPDGKLLYVPQFEGPMWTVVDGKTGNVITRVETKAGSHNTVYANDGSRVYLAGLKSPLLSIVNPKTHKVTGTVGPFTNVIRPFTVNGANTLAFVNVNGLLGFEIGDIGTGKKLHRIEIQGYQPGPVKRHGCPSHGIALTPDEKELWVVDGHNNAVHVFDNTVMPPKQTVSITLRDSPGWWSFSLDGKFGYSSTGEIVDVATKKIVASLKDETGREVHSEKVLDIVVDHGKVIKANNQFGVGQKK